ncbi:type II toxin-antitoxin system HicB family antitoxin [Actinomadura sp. LOL_016]|uniref:type II toxin-antitoxin system HicB family antitoxin n=1 Tax=unclassified Actinomadura TaxID=2626254 RepID=UPI003A7FD83A
MLSKYAVAVDWAEGSNSSAHVPDLPACVAAGARWRRPSTSSVRGIEFHFEGMREDGEEIPEPSTVAVMAEAA